MNDADATPVAGEVLTTESVKLLRKGDRLKSRWNWPQSRWLGDCTVTSIPAEGRTLFMARFDHTGEVGGFGGYVGDQLSDFTFVSRPSPATPVLHPSSGGDQGFISAQEAEIPDMDKSGDASHLLSFGLGHLVVDTGKYHGRPAVFISTSEIAGEVGASAAHLGHDRKSLRPGERVLSFPTMAQALAVADALVCPPTTGMERSGIDQAALDQAQQVQS